MTVSPTARHNPDLATDLDETLGDMSAAAPKR